MSNQSTIQHPTLVVTTHETQKSQELSPNLPSETSKSSLQSLFSSPRNSTPRQAGPSLRKTSIWSSEGSLVSEISRMDLHDEGNQTLPPLPSISTFFTKNLPPSSYDLLKSPEFDTSTRPPSEIIINHLHHFFPGVDFEQEVESPMGFYQGLDSSLDNVSSHLSLPDLGNSNLNLPKMEPSPTSIQHVSMDISSIHTMSPSSMSFSSLSLHDSPRPLGSDGVRRNSKTLRSLVQESAMKRHRNSLYSKSPLASSTNSLKHSSPKSPSRQIWSISSMPMMNIREQGTPKLKSVMEPLKPPMTPVISSSVSSSAASTPTPTPISPELDLLKILDEIKMEIPMKWTRGKSIGKGSFGEVYLSLNLLDGSLMASKEVLFKSSPVSTSTPGTHRHPLNMICNEILTLEMSSHYPHPNIITYRGFEYDNSSIRMFVDYVSGGSIQTLLNRVGKFDEIGTRFLIRQVLDGLTHLHSLGVVHRDIKGANILVDDEGLAKIADFGTAKRISKPYEINKRMSVQGTVYWMAPEVLRSENKSSLGYGAKVDIWSIGCLVIEMLSGTHPWSEFKQIQALWQLGLDHVPPFPEDISPITKDFLEKCLCIDPEERPTAMELLEHEFCKEEEFEFIPWLTQLVNKVDSMSGSNLASISTSLDSLILE